MRELLRIVIAELSSKHGASLDKLTEQVRKGIKVELEHSEMTSVDVAKYDIDTLIKKFTEEDLEGKVDHTLLMFLRGAEKIALDHLGELPDYYDRLEKVEKKNASQMPRVYYCRHIEKGVVGYEDEMVLINDDALNKLDQTMAGIPVRVHHVDDIDVHNIQAESDGYVSESFYLECDGWHWAKFICVSDEAHKRVSEGWSVSNAYTPTAWGGNGVYHNIPYDREITDGKYGHLAIVPNPRYEGSVIMTPEEFKEYKESKEKELKELQNEKKEKKVMFKFKFLKKTAVENEVDGSTTIQLKNDKEISIDEIQNTVDEMEVLKKENEELKLENKKLKKTNSDEEVEKERLANMSDEEKAEEEKKRLENMTEEEKAAEEKKNQEEKKKEEEEKEKEKKNALNLKQADIQNSGEVIVETSQDKLARGASRYGSA
ncbi:MAG: DUF2213 domain-containing protein [Deltaproteobacteria bacterium]|nr:DUF2213 domain-containing protein [Deltaproteobacteria bacterium]